MASMKTTSDLPGHSQSQSDQSPTVMNGSVVTPSVGAAGLLQNAQLTSELKHLMGTLLGGQGGSGVSLEQLLQSSTSSGHLSQVKPALPAPQQQPAPQAALTPPNPTTPSGAQGLWGSRKRSHASFDADDSSNPKRRRSTSYSARQSGEKQHNKGLRHFSQRVCEKVRQKGTTSYNEVADELVKELSETEKKTSGSSDGPIDHKNIRRRVYDALNVLMAMNIISKEKKEIKWIGLPTNSIQECQHIEAELAQTEERIQSKRTQVEDLLVQILTFKNLMKRNRERVDSLGAPGHHHSSIGLPFIIVNTSKKTTIDCSISSDKSEYVFNFDNTFELHNDIDVLKKMGLDCGLHSGSCTADDLRQAKAMLPKAFESTLDEIALSKNFPIPGSLPHTPTTPIAVSSGLRPSPSLTSTPTTSGFLHASSRPSVHSPLVQGTSTASPLSSTQIAAALAQVRQANATLQAQQVGSVSPGVALDSPGRLSAPTTPKVSIPSPGAVTALVKSALRGAGAKTPVKLLNVSPSAVSSAKAQLHGHSPSQSSFSPLVKATTSLAAVSQGESPQLSKSPGPKIVTVSKLPTSTGNAELNSLLQALQQNSNLLKQLPLVAGGISLANGSSNGTGSGPLVDGVSCTSGTASLPIQTGQTGQTSPLVHTTLLSNGLATTTM